MAPTKITNHAELAQGKLLQQFKNKTVWPALLDTYSAQVQAIEDMFFELAESRYLDTAAGVQLDGLGRIIGIARGGLDDEPYRTRLRAQIAINLSSGTVEDILEIMGLIFPVGTTFDLQEHAQTAIQLVVEQGVVGTLGDEAHAVLQSAKAAGVKAVLWWFSAADDAFQFTTTGTVQTDADKGFGDDTLSAVGGLLANAQG